jgi:hypothetical protein
LVRLAAVREGNGSQAGELAPFSARLAFPFASGRRPKNVPVRLGLMNSILHAGVMG